MISARCIRKIRDNNNVVIKYELEASDGEKIIVTSYQLKVAMTNKQIEISNLQLTKDNKIMDKSIESSIDGLANINKDTEADESARKLFNKTKLTGTAPELNTNGGVVNAQGDDVVFTDVTNEIADDIKAKTVIFKGRLPLKLAEKVSWKKATLNIIADTCMIENQSVMTNINKEIPVGAYDVRLFAETVLINFESIPVKIVDMIFKLIKGNINNLYHPNKKFTYMITFNVNKVCDGDVNDLFKRSLMVLKRQKPSEINARRFYDLQVYQAFILSMYNSFSSAGGGNIPSEIYKGYKGLYNTYKAEIYLLLNKMKINSVVDAEYYTGSSNSERGFAYAGYRLLEAVNEKLTEIFKI